MIAIKKFLTCLAVILSFSAIAKARCITIKDVTKAQETYLDCYPNRYCQNKMRVIEKGPIIYSCSETNLTEINNKLKTNVENLIFIYHSQIAALEPPYYSLDENGYFWTNLTEFHLRNTNTLKMVPGFFNKFTELQVLEITDNLLEDIIDGTFSPLTTLVKLNLSRNSIAELRPHTFSGLRNLKVLDLSQNKIASISSDVFAYQPFLEYIDISQNVLKDVGDVFVLLNVVSINLSMNNLIDFDFFQLEISPFLKNVDLSENSIKNLTNISSVCASTISLSHNRITTLKAIQCITKFNISHNLIQVLDENMCESDLELLDLSYNNITKINPKSFQNARHLKYLYLNHNNLPSLPRESLLNLTKVGVIDLSYNNMNEIPFGLFNNLDELTYLDLSQNNMLLDFDTLSTLNTLEVLHFQNNQIRHFDLNTILVRYQNLKVLTLTDNLWNCSELAKTIHTLQFNKIQVSKGNNTQSSNILGISCNDNPNSKEETIVLKRKAQDMTKNNTEALLTPELSKNLKDVVMQYLNENFTDKLLHKYADDLIELQNITSQTFLETVKGLSSELANQTYSDKKAGPTNCSITKTVSDNLIKIANSINNTFSDISVNINRILTFQNSSFDRFLYSLRGDSADASTHTDVQSDVQMIVDKSVDTVIVENLVISNIILLLMLCSVLGCFYYIFWRFRYLKSPVQEQLQLL